MAPNPFLDFYVPVFLGVALGVWLLATNYPSLLAKSALPNSIKVMYMAAPMQLALLCGAIVAGLAMAGYRDVTVKQITSAPEDLMEKAKEIVTPGPPPPPAGAFGRYY